MKFKCPECGKMLKVADEMAGKRGKCLGCKNTVTAPNVENGPSQIPGHKPPEPPPMLTPDHEFEIIQETGKKQKWQLSLYGDRLILHYPETGTLVEVLHNQAIDKLKTAKLFFLPPILVVKDFKKFTYRIQSDEYEIINEWIGKPLLLKKALKQRLSWCLPIGSIYILTSLPLSEDPTAGIESIPFDPIGMGLGIMLIILSIIIKKKPHPALFVADSIWFFLLLCYTLFQIYSGANTYWGVVIILCIILIMSGINHYRYFSDVQAA
jgi:ssDNA-binding Zn-finger/Zn-ribbon topoisomerase 1